MNKININEKNKNVKCIFIIIGFKDMKKSKKYSSFMKNFVLS